MDKYTDKITKIKECNDPNIKSFLINEFLEENMGLVVEAVNKYLSDKTYLDDMIQEGSLAFVKAIDDFDLSLNVNFSTYAYTCIQNAVRRAIKKESSTIAIPEYIANQLNNIMKTEKELEEKLSRTPKIEEICEALNMTKEKYLEFKSYALHVINPDGSMEFDESSPLFKDVNLANPEEIMISEDDLEILMDSIDELDDLEKDIVKKAYGIEEDKITIQGIANLYKISVDKVRTILKGAIKKMRESMEEYNEI